MLQVFHLYGSPSNFRNNSLFSTLSEKSKFKWLRGERRGLHLHGLSLAACLCCLCTNHSQIILVRSFLQVCLHLSHPWIKWRDTFQQISPSPESAVHILWVLSQWNIMRKAPGVSVGEEHGWLLRGSWCPGRLRFTLPNSDWLALTLDYSSLA